MIKHVFFLTFLIVFVACETNNAVRTEEVIEYTDTIQANSSTLTAIILIDSSQFCQSAKKIVIDTRPQ
jgi:thioredoxin-related protein